MELIKSAWRSPSNIAIVKYWGKKGFQIPANPSISFTLDNIFTETEIILKDKKSDKDIDIDFFFEGEPKPEFLPKILQFLNSIVDDFQWLKKYCLEIHSKNNFPYGTGIASSASSMSALALCLLDLNVKLNNLEISSEDFFQKASFYSRIGSGSACRSVYGGFTEWGNHNDIANSNDEFAIEIKDVHPDFLKIKDSVLLVENTEKSVSSTKGHAMLNEHWYASKRFEQGFEQTKKLYSAIRNGDIKTFGKIAEQEALTLHAMMLTSENGYFLIQPNTLNVLNEIREYRRKTGIDLYFTMDAGANVHLLYFEKQNDIVKEFIENSLLKFCSNNEVIHSGLGAGPERI